MVITACVFNFQKQTESSVLIEDIQVLFALNKELKQCLCRGKIADVKEGRVKQSKVES